MGHCSEAGEVEPLISPQGLIASLCISSCFIPDLIPLLQTRVYASCVYMHLYNHYDHLGRGKHVLLKNI